MSTKVVLTGMRTTGVLHLGHYVGALKQWLDVQAGGEHECFFLLADIQALTTHAENPALLRQSVRDVTLDWLSVGLDPTLPNVHFVLQSQVPERHELAVLLAMIATHSEVLRDPTLKAEMAEQRNPTLGMVNYPVDQAADIYMVNPQPYSDQDEVLVPVGEDQAPHLELARELARRFNGRYGNTFMPCQALIGQVGRLVGLNGGEKMSKSIGNTIDLSDNAETVQKKINRMVTDPNRIRPDIPGETENNPLFVYQRAFNPNPDEIADYTQRYQQGKVGDVEVKRNLAQHINNLLDPIRDRRAQFENVDIREILESGTNAAREACKPVVAAVRERMHLAYPT